MTRACAERTTGRSLTLVTSRGGPGLSVASGILTGMPACDCCRSPNAQFPPVKAPDGLPVAVRVCGICARHQGSHPRDLRRREEEHFQQWQFDLELAVEQERRIGQRREKVIRDLEDEILRLKDEMAARPVQVVDRNLDQEMVDEALRSRDDAYAARDAAWTFVA